MTIEEVAERLRVPVATLRYWRSQTLDGPPSFKAGRHVRYRRGDLEGWIAERIEKKS